MVNDKQIPIEKVDDVQFYSLILKSILIAKFMDLASPVSVVKYLDSQEQDPSLEFFKDYVILCSPDRKKYGMNIDSFLRKWFGTDDLMENEYHKDMMNGLHKTFIASEDNNQ